MLTRKHMEKARKQQQVVESIEWTLKNGGSLPALGDRIKFIKGTNVEQTFENELIHLLNKYSREQTSNTPDFLLAQYMIGCLELYERAVQSREGWTIGDTHQFKLLPEDDANIGKIRLPLMPPQYRLTQTEHQDTHKCYAFQMTAERRDVTSDWPDWLHQAWNLPHDKVNAVFPKDYPHSDGKDRLVVRFLPDIGGSLDRTNLVTVDWGDYLLLWTEHEDIPDEELPAIEVVREEVFNGNFEKIPR